jgi:hypothetical protein
MPLNFIGECYHPEKDFVSSSSFCPGDSIEDIFDTNLMIIGTPIHSGIFLMQAIISSPLSSFT